MAPNVTKSTSPPAPPSEDMNSIRPFTNTAHPDVLLSGTLEKESIGLVGRSTYRKFFFRMRADEIAYYTKVNSAKWGYVPIDERGRIPTRLIGRIELGDDKQGRCFTLWVTNAENNRYPGRNHKRKDKDFERSYSFRAMDTAVRDAWTTKIQEAMDGKHSDFTSLKKQTVESNPKEDGLKDFRTNLGRLLSGGDDWDELPALPLKAALDLRDAEFNEVVNAKTKRYIVKDPKLAKKIAQFRPPEEDAREPNEQNAMIDRRHKTVASKAEANAPLPTRNEAPSIEEGKGGCKCIIS